MQRFLVFRATIVSFFVLTFAAEIPDSGFLIFRDPIIVIDLTAVLVALGGLLVLTIGFIVFGFIAGYVYARFKSRLNTTQFSPTPPFAPKPVPKFTFAAPTPPNNNNRQPTNTRLGRPIQPIIKRRTW
ncbi:Oidioi.mRNA.OKI2018_I69.XSR.g16575.t1.cds [Oikopleura dioica]|uniref:Oidioi.mRNA.OKI2018_I69.XSR.g16575.t1.cds n=1 Tax=Oikopleura dioica TaxID=34765 RepID=A0ABN7SKS0_OIKDI|nr:Oidioi.mRNA.OKI2018_I69.XSR.g16575.t1.cds [Oikopleura dioica]